MTHHPNGSSTGDQGSPEPSPATEPNQIRFECDKCGLPMVVQRQSVVLATKCARCHCDLLIHPSGKVQRRLEDDDWGTLPSEHFENHQDPGNAQHVAEQFGDADTRIYRPLNVKMAGKEVDTAKIVRAIIGSTVALSCAIAMITAAVIYGPGLIEKSGIDQQLSIPSVWTGSSSFASVQTLLDQRQTDLVKIGQDIASTHDTVESVPASVTQNWIKQLDELAIERTTLKKVVGFRPPDDAAFQSWNTKQSEYSQQLDLLEAPGRWSQRNADLHRRVRDAIQWQRTLLELATVFSRPLELGDTEPERLVAQAVEIDRNLYRKVILAVAPRSDGGEIDDDEVSEAIAEATVAYQDLEDQNRQWFDEHPGALDWKRYQRIKTRFGASQFIETMVSRSVNKFSEFNQARESLWNR